MADAASSLSICPGYIEAYFVKKIKSIQYIEHYCICVLLVFVTQL